MFGIGDGLTAESVGGGGAMLAWPRSAAKAGRVRSQLLHSLTRALSALTELTSLTLICHAISAEALGWGNTRSLRLPRLRLPRLTRLSIRPAAAAAEMMQEHDAAAFALIGLGPRCELPSLRHYGKRSRKPAPSSLTLLPIDALVHPSAWLLPDPACSPACAVWCLCAPVASQLWTAAR